MSTSSIGFKLGFLVISGAMSALLYGAGCSQTVVESTGATGGQGGQGGQGGAPSAGRCGGLHGLLCGPDEWCEYDSPGTCGDGDGMGSCQPRPQGCTKDCPGVTGCDGQHYCNACMAHQAGHDVRSSTDPSSCDDARDLLAAEASKEDVCSTVVRLDYQTRAILGYALICDHYSVTNEASARATALADTTFGSSSDLLLSSGDQGSAFTFVFYRPAGDFGGAAAVNAKSGITVFGGSIIWDGAGDINHPKAWKSAADLGLSCGSISLPIARPEAHGFSLVDGKALPKADVDAALATLWSTALPAGLRKVSLLFPSTVLLYPRTVGGFDPQTAEWIVILDSARPD